MSEPFAIDVSEGAVRDLRRRLEATRWPVGVDSDGIARSALEPIVDYWRTGYDWSRQQESLNRRPQFVETVSGTRIHFVHLRASDPRAKAVLLLHGWPGSFIELLEVAELLGPDYNLVIPSVPGFGFSPVPDQAGMSNRRIAGLLVTLMTALGYDTFAAHGGDIGAGIASWIALDFPQHLTALHINYIPGSYAPPEAGDPTEEERAFLQFRAEWSDSAGAYAHIQRTTPLTAAYGLSDSPVGLAAWLIEKFRLWADPASTIPLDVILTNLSIYWFTNTIAGSMRYYLESSKTPLALPHERRITVPTTIARFPLEMPFPPRSWVERGYDVVRWTEMPRGGHFAALEAPDLLAADLREWLR